MGGGARDVPEVQGGSDGGESHVAHPDGHSQPELVRHLSQVRPLSMTASVADFNANPPPLDRPEPPEQVQVATLKAARHRRTSCGGRRDQSRPSSEASSAARSSYEIMSFAI